ncbi:RNA ligase family protein [Nonomuraea longicatena]|uniref:RNA ligase domain-containing protein n=1 Tax=Nonomuraea longicatena TaxID=83682 RepID=A0ABN1QVV4_9ACTN
MDVDWPVYPKMPRRAGPTPPSGGRWVATEKIHGAHLAVVCTEESVRPAKRRTLLSEAELDSFFGLSRCWPALAVTAADLARRLREAEGSDGTVILYGELAGGHYPHPHTPSPPGVQPVQTGVWYHPDLIWVLFDAVHTSGDTTVWTADAALRRAAAEAGVHCAPVLAEGSLAAVGERAPAFPSLLPARFGLPALPDNLAEGLVLKPADRWTAAARPVIKNKHPRFAEDARYQGSRPYEPPEEGAAGVPGWLVAEAAQRLTPNRAAAAMSKLGPAVPAEVLAEEILTDLLTDLEEDLGGLDPAHLTALRHTLAAGAGVLAGQYLTR